jgi:hypothetical protein
LSLKINGSVIGSNTFPEYPPDNGGQWQNYQFTWNSGSSKTADLVLLDLNTDVSWNDFALDDISFSTGPSPAAGIRAAPHNAPASGQ